MHIRLTEQTQYTSFPYKVTVQALCPQTQYTTFPYKVTVQALCPQTNLNRRKFEFRCDTKI